MSPQRLLSSSGRLERQIIGGSQGRSGLSNPGSCRLTRTSARCGIVAALYSLVHREEGPIATFTPLDEAEAELRAVLEDEPDSLLDLWVEPSEFVVKGHTFG